MTDNNKNYKSIPLKETRLLSKLMKDYLFQNDELKNLIFEFPDLKNIEKFIQQRKNFKNQDRKTLVEILKNQYKDSKENTNRNTQIERLLDDNTFTICTAHQPILFTGPSYFFFKTMYAIFLSQKIQSVYPQYHFIPVFYIGSEDDDWEEIGEINVGENKYSWQPPQKTISGQTKFDEKAIAIWQEILKIIPSDIAHSIPEAKVGQSFSTFTRNILDYFFVDDGLLIIDAHNPKFKTQIKSEIEEDLINKKTEQILKTNLEFLRKNYTLQANPQEYNFFFVENNERKKIVADGAGVKINNDIKAFESQEDWKKFVDQNIENFAPNVFYRPLLQETILPNIAFVGGGGECAYWLELKPLFDNFNIPYPALFLRQSISFLKEKSFEKLEKNNLSINGIFKNEQDFFNQTIFDFKIDIEYKNNTESLKDAWNLYLKNISDKFEILKSAEVFSTQMIEKGIKHLEKKIKKSLLLKDENKVNAYKLLREEIFPNGILQEREKSIWEFLIYFENKKAFKTTVLNAFELNESVRLILI